MRDEWRFQFHAEDLLDASRVKKHHHKERLNFWTDEKEKSGKNMREKGIEIREQPGSSGYVGLVPVIDQALQARYQECCTKVRQHAEAVDTFDRWERAFAKSHATFDLDVSDVQFFGL